MSFVVVALGEEEEDSDSPTSSRKSSRIVFLVFWVLWKVHIYFFCSRTSSNAAIMPWFGEDPQKKMMGRLTIIITVDFQWNFKEMKLVLKEFSCYMDSQELLLRRPTFSDV